MRIVHLAAECDPLAKVGGLADVVGALPKFQNRLGHDAMVVMPRYGSVDLADDELDLVHQGEVVYRDHSLSFKAWELPQDRLGFRVYLIDEPEHFGYNGVYQDENTGRDFENQGDRFFVFQLCALDTLMQRPEAVDVLHLHDHHTALVAALIRDDEAYAALASVPTVFTVHNAEYQGVYPWEAWEALGVEASQPEAMQLNGKLNSMRTALYYADAVTTVSPAYAEELQTNEELVTDLLKDFQAIADKTTGILNGIDPEVWSPEQDTYVAATYSQDDLTGKRIDKQEVSRELDLDPDLPLFTFIGRLMKEKGATLLAPAVEYFLTRHDDVNVVILGTGYPEYQEAMTDVAERVNAGLETPRLVVRLEFNNALAHQLYAGSDVLMMPSKVEPCGLNQMYALTYGTVPVVHAVGGLRDTVEECDPLEGTGNGFRFEAFTAEAFCEALDRSLASFRHPNVWNTIRQNGMTQDWTWNRSVKAYLDLYKTLIG